MNNSIGGINVDKLKRARAIINVDPEHEREIDREYCTSSEEEEEVEEINELANEMVKEMSKHDLLESFWEMMSRITWKNRSEGNVSESDVKRLFKDMSKLNKKIFHDAYWALSNDILTRLEDIFITVNLENDPKCPRKNKEAVISHIIACGRDVYQQFHETPTLAEWLINEKEYRNFFKHIPEEIIRMNDHV